MSQQHRRMLTATRLYRFGALVLILTRDVRQAPDGTIYIAIERDTQLGPGSTKLTPTGSILKIAPAD